MTLAPVTTTGSVQTTVVSRRDIDGGNELTVQEGFSIDAGSYIWQPWFVQVRSGVDIAHDKTFGSGGGSSISGSADLGLSVLPRSKYPVSLGIAHFDSRASGEFGGSDFTRDRAFINARAVLTQNLRGGLRASWDRTDQEDSGIQTTRRVNLDLNQTFSQDDAFLGITSLGLNIGLSDSDLDSTDPDQEDGSHQLATVQIDTHSEPFENLFYDSLITAIYDDEVDGDDESQRMSLQGNSTLQWRPEDQPYIVTGSLRTLTEKIKRDDDGGSADSDTTLAAATLGLRWPVNDQLSFSLGLQGSYQNVKRDEGSELGEDAAETGEQIDAAFIASADYISERRKLSGFDWRWNALATTDNGYSNVEGMSTRERFGLGHRFERMFEDLIFVPVRFSFAQNANLGFNPDSEDQIDVGLSDSIAFSYSDTEAAASTFARLSLRDNRTLIGEKSEFQTLQARIGRRVAINRDRRIQGDITAQASREASEDETDIFITASGNITYSHLNLFNIENLGFRSELQINVVNLDDLFGRTASEPDSELLRNDWRNILSYRIGRLTANLEATVFQQDAGFGYLSLLRLRRDFSGSL